MKNLIVCFGVVVGILLVFSAGTAFVGMVVAVENGPADAVGTDSTGANAVVIQMLVEKAVRTRVMTFSLSLLLC